MKHAGTINHGKVPSSTNGSASGIPAADYRLLFESVPAPCLVLDLEFRIVAVNDAYLRATMTKREEILGRSIFEVFPDNPAEPDATGVCNLSASLKRILQNKVADTMAVQKYDIRKPEKKGGGFEERYWSPINTPVFGAGDEIAYIIHRVEDVTEFVHLKQKEVEEHKLTEELRERAVQMEAEIYARAQEIQRLASFPLMNPNPVLELDANGQMTFCNPAAKQILENAGYSTGTNPLLPQDISVILQSLRDKKTGQFFREIEINGSFFEELIYIAPQFQSVRIYTMDITERKQSEDEIKKLNAILSVRATELEDANRELEAFNYTAAHDLRQPLNVISGYCQVINELCGDKLDEKCKEYLQETYGGTMRMNRLIEALLNFSHLTHIEPHREEVDLSMMAHELVAELMLTGPERRVEIRIADGLDANGDARLLRMVLANLLGNAWKYTAMRAEAVIEFAATEINGQPVYFVRDNGSGFDMAYADKLFAPFQRLPGAEEYRGFGIGLATVERIIRRHGGRIWAEGEPGKGATFSFTLSAD